MIKISNEREALPIVKSPLKNWAETERLILPLIESFLESDIQIDEYKGWAFSMVFIKKGNAKYEDAVASMNMEHKKEKDNWVFAPSENHRRESIWMRNDIVIVVHLESWLWFE